MVHDSAVDSARVALLREVLSSTPWVDRTRSFARDLRSSTRIEHGLLLVGTPQAEPWHLAAHLDDESRFAGIPELSPVLVRHRIPDGAPPHLSVGLARLEVAKSGETLFVVAPGPAPEPLLDRVDDARRHGATVMSMHSGDDDLQSLAHESLVLPELGLILPQSTQSLQQRAFAASGSLGIDTLSDAELDSTLDSFDVMQHLVSTAVGESALTAPTSSSSSRRAFRDRLGRMLDAISGPSIARD